MKQTEKELWGLARDAAANPAEMGEHLLVLADYVDETDSEYADNIRELVRLERHYHLAEAIIKVKDRPRDTVWMTWLLRPDGFMLGGGLVDRKNSPIIKAPAITWRELISIRKDFILRSLFYRHMNIMELILASHYAGSVKDGKHLGWTLKGWTIK